MSGEPLYRKHPRGFLRWLARLPITLYRLRLGWLFGNRFLLLHHVGRKTGLPRRVVLEVVNHDRQSGSYVVAAAWGHRADWLRNLEAHPRAAIEVGLRRMEVGAQRLDPEEAERVFREYARRYPFALRILSRVMGYPVRGTEEDIQQLAELVPLVRLSPRAAAYEEGEQEGTAVNS